MLKTGTLIRGDGQKPRPPLIFTPFQSQEWNSVLTDYALGGWGGRKHPYGPSTTYFVEPDFELFFNLPLKFRPPISPPSSPRCLLHHVATGNDESTYIVRAPLCWTSSHTSRPCCIMLSVNSYPNRGRISFLKKRSNMALFVDLMRWNASQVQLTFTWNLTSCIQSVQKGIQWTSGGRGGLFTPKNTSTSE